MKRLGYESVRGYHQFLFALIEMRDLERLVAKEAADASKQADIPRAKEVFDRWAQESDGHRQALQNTIDKLKGTTLVEDCETCMEDILATSNCRMRMLERLEIGFGSSGIKELYALLKKHLIIEGTAERRYVEIAKMMDNKPIKNMLMKLAENEKKHHSEAQLVINVLEKDFGEIVKEV